LRGVGSDDVDYFLPAHVVAVAGHSFPGDGVGVKVDDYGAEYSVLLVHLKLPAFGSIYTAECWCWYDRQQFSFTVFYSAS
jgi:hypothetical protein